VTLHPTGSVGPHLAAWRRAWLTFGRARKYGVRLPGEPRAYLGADHPRRMAQLTPADLAALRATGQSLDAAFQVGKDGASEGVVKELQAHLSREPLVKVRILKSAGEGDTRAVAEALARGARVVLVEVRGHTALFHRPPRHKRGPEDF